MRLGIIARSDNTGLGNQTRELVNMLKPDKVLLIDSSSFNQNKQHPEWYKDFDLTINQGFLRKDAVINFVKSVDVILSCETFYSDVLVPIAKRKGVKTILQYNYEFLDHLQRPELDLPDVLISPSYWNLQNVVDKFGERCRVVHIAPPTDGTLFEEVKNTNISKDHGRLLHVAGKVAANDRNGTQTVLDMLKHSKEDYELVITTQSDFDLDIKDSRVTISMDNPDNREELYRGFDAMVLPRRYAGLCLPMNEALLSGLPVFMTNISPNNNILPQEWLVDATTERSFMTRTMIDIYDGNEKDLARVVDSYMSSNKIDYKNKAYEIGQSNFSYTAVIDKYLEVIN